MSNANKHSNTPASSTSSTPVAASTASASSPTKPTIAGGEVKISVGNGSSAAPDVPPSVQTNGQTTSTASAGAAADDASAAPDSESDPLMFYVVTGAVRQFKTAAKAEEYLNGPEAPPPDAYTVIRGRVATTKRKISLRG